MKAIKKLYLFLLNIIAAGYKILKRHFINAGLQSKNPTCKIYASAKIASSKLNKHVVIFDNVTLLNCEVGSHSYIQKNSRIFNSKIGNFCSIAANVSVAPGIHKIDGVSTHPAFYLKNTPLAITFADKDYFNFSKQVIIEHDVWIGENVIILDGLTVGTGAIIAAGSVVTKNIEPYAIVGGIPAKLIKYRFSEEEIRLLLKSEWWNFSNSWFVENFKRMHYVSEFLLEIERNEK